MIAMTRLFRCDLLKRDCTATELRELSEAIDRCLYPLGQKDAIVFDEVCSHFGISRVALHSKGRQIMFTFPRHVVMYLLSQRGYDSGRIAKYFGNNHGNVCTAIKAVRNRCDTEPSTQRLITELSRNIDKKIGDATHGAALYRPNRQYPCAKNGKRELPER